MQIVLIALALAAVAVAAPVEPGLARLVKVIFDLDPEGNYKYGFESDDGTSKYESGEVREVVDEENKVHNVVVTRGSYTYINSEGKLETIEYTADELGFHPEGPSIPKPVSPRTA